MAMDADSACRQVKFSQDDLVAMDRVAANEMVALSPNVSLGAGRLLNLRRLADDQFGTLYGREGCDGQKVKKLVAFYDERLRPRPSRSAHALARRRQGRTCLRHRSGNAAARRFRPAPGRYSRNGDSPQRARPKAWRPLRTRCTEIVLAADQTMPEEGAQYAIFTFEPSAYPSDTRERRHFRNALGHYPNGITIVTALADNGERVGLTVNSFTSISLHPPLIVFAVALRANSAPVFQRNVRFAVNILCSGQEAVSARFARFHPDKFSGIAFHDGIAGVPLIDGSSAWLEAMVQDVHPCGDHLLIVGRVDRFAYREHADPLVYHRSRYRTLEPEPEPPC